MEYIKDKKKEIRNSFYSLQNLHSLYYLLCMEFQCFFRFHMHSLTFLVPNSGHYHVQSGKLQTKIKLNILFIILPIKTYFRFCNSFGLDITTWLGLYVTDLVQAVSTFVYFVSAASLTALQFNLSLYVNACFQDFMELCVDINGRAIAIRSCSHNEIHGKNVKNKQLIKAAIGLHNDLFK